jgi:hypothetical protein
MLESIVGSLNREKVLVFMIARQEGYAREIARFYDTDLDPIQKQLDKLEQGSVLYSRMIGRTRLYAFNPLYSLLPELKALLEKTLSFYPKGIQIELTENRRRPRRRKKPL